RDGAPEHVGAGRRFRRDVGAEPRPARRRRQPPRRTSDPATPSPRLALLPRPERSRDRPNALHQPRVREAARVPRTRRPDRATGGHVMTERDTAALLRAALQRRAEYAMQTTDTDRE